MKLSRPFRDDHVVWHGIMDISMSILASLINKEDDSCKRI
jgi:hypothetical protein